MGIVPISDGAALAQAADESAAVTFADQIAPLVFANCTTCHRPGEVAPFLLLSFADVRKHARTMLLVMQSRHMPPSLLPILLLDAGVPVRLPDSQFAGLILFAVWIYACLISGLTGMLSGAVWTGRQAILATLICLVLTDILAVAYLGSGFALLYTASAVAKVLWITIQVLQGMFSNERICRPNAVFLSRGAGGPLSSPDSHSMPINGAFVIHSAYAPARSGWHRLENHPGAAETIGQASLPLGEKAGGAM